MSPYRCILFCTLAVIGQPLAIQAQQPADSLRAIYRQQTDTIKLESLRRLAETVVKENDSLRKYALLGLAESQAQQNLDYEGKFLMYLTIAEQNASRFESAITYGKQAINQFNRSSNNLWAAGVSAELAQVFIQLLQYDSAMFYLMQALEYHAKLSVNPGTLETMSHIAHVHELSGNLDQSIEWTQKMLALSKAHGFPYYESEAYFNLGKIYDLKQDYDSAIYFKHQALRNTSDVKYNNLAFLLGSLGHSHMEQGNLDSALYYESKFYELTRDESRVLYRRDQRKAISAINLGAVYLQLGRNKEAKRYLDEGLKLASSSGNKDQLQEAHHWLYQLALKQNRYQDALNHHLSYSNLKSESINAENQRAIQQLSFQYDSKQKAQEISLLKLEAELGKARFTRVQIWLYITLLGIIVLLGFGLLLFNRLKYKQRALLSEERMRHQRSRFKSVIEGEEKERKRIAAELHDGLGQLLSTARLNLDAAGEKGNGSRSKLLQNSIKLLDSAISEVRNISHNMMPNALVSIGFESALREQVHLINDTGKFKVHLETPDEKLILPEELAISLYRIMQEILNNAMKYSQAENIWIKLAIQNDNTISINVKDDGKGFDTHISPSRSGIGWENINSRVEVINGEISIVSSPQTGTSIQLRLAV